MLGGDAVTVTSGEADGPVLGVQPFFQDGVN